MDFAPPTPAPRPALAAAATRPRFTLLPALLLLLLVAAPGSAPSQTYDSANRIEPIRRKAGGVAGSIISDEDLRNFLKAPIPYSALDFYRAQVEALESLPESVKAAADTRNDLAVAHLWTGRPDLAAEMLVALTDEHPNNVDYLRNLSAAFERVGLPKRALEVAQKANALDRQRLEDFEEGRLRRLNYKLSAQNPTWAINNLHRPEFTNAFNVMGIPPKSFSSLRLSSSREAVMRELMNTIRFEPDFADGWLCLGMLIEGRYNYTLAYDFFQRAIALNHHRSVEISNHVRAMGPMLPRGYTIGSLGGLLLFNIGVGVGVGALILLANWAAGRYFEGRSLFAMLASLGKKRKKKWRPEDWASHHEDQLYRQLREALDEDPEGGDPDAANPVTARHDAPPARGGRRR
jgi:tetratricopeptide (TPR) repeat protein